MHRFAKVLLGDETLARQITLEVIEGAITQPAAHSDGAAIGRFLFQEVRRKALERQPAPIHVGNGTPEELPSSAAAVADAASSEQIEAALRQLPEPGRSALALLLLDALDTESIARVLTLPEPDLAATLHAARANLHAALSPVEAGTGGQA